MAVEDFLRPVQRLRVAILGSTGSIGRQALDVARSFPERLEVAALAVHDDVEGVSSQAEEFGVSLIGCVSGPLDAPAGVKVIQGERSAATIAEEAEADIVLNAVVGAAGLHATLATIESGKILALANKESLVLAGEVVMAKARPGQIRPVDSEHSALWQLLEHMPPEAVRKVVLTGSGGPFRGRTAGQLAGTTVEEALSHPVWEMGRKITIDSATLMNKGLEVIEAHFLFGLTYDEIEVLIHPEGRIHALVECLDGSVLAHAAVPDMRLPIQVALLWPERALASRVPRLQLDGTALTFEPPDTDTFRCLALAYEAGRRGDTYPAVLNAANEVAVEAFLSERLDFSGIPLVVERAMEEHRPAEATLEGVIDADSWARTRASELAHSLTR